MAVETRKKQPYYLHFHDPYVLLSIPCPFAPLSIILSLFPFQSFRFTTLYTHLSVQELTQVYTYLYVLMNVLQILCICSFSNTYYFIFSMHLQCENMSSEYVPSEGKKVSDSLQLQVEIVVSHLCVGTSAREACTVSQ